MQILDCDDVLANFQAGATDLVGMPPKEFEQIHGAAAFWDRLEQHPDFYGRLPLMADAEQLFAAARRLNSSILTGLARGTRAEAQKRAWDRRYFPDVPVICCWSAAKHEHARPGEILVDDQLRAAEKWQAAGGRLVHHTSAAATIAALASLGVSINDAALNGELA